MKEVNWSIQWSVYCQAYIRNVHVHQPYTNMASGSEDPELGLQIFVMWFGVCKEIRRYKWSHLPFIKSKVMAAIYNLPQFHLLIISKKYYHSTKNICTHILYGVHITAINRWWLPIGWIRSSILINMNLSQFFLFYYFVYKKGYYTNYIFKYEKNDYNDMGTTRV